MSPSSPTPGQIAYEAFWPTFDTAGGTLPGRYTPWVQLSPAEHAALDASAHAVVDAWQTRPLASPLPPTPTTTTTHLSFCDNLTALLNRYNQETASNTPDWILAEYLLACLHTWNTTMQQRQEWYAAPTASPVPVPPPQTALTPPFTP